MHIKEHFECREVQFRHEYLWKADDRKGIHDLRHHLVAALSPLVDLDVLDVTELLCGELLANAIQHAHTPRGEQLCVTLSALITGESLVVEVTDPDPHLPCRRQADEADESGRGLALIDELARESGVRPRGDGKTVWFSLPCHMEDNLISEPESISVESAA